MKKIVFLLLVVMIAACSKEDGPSALKSALISAIQSAETLIAGTEEGIEPGMTAPGSKETLQARVDWAGFILQNSGTDTAFARARQTLEAAVEAFNNNKVKPGIPKFTNGSYFDLGKVQDLAPSLTAFTIECRVKLTDLNTDGTANLGSFITADDGTRGILLRYTKAGRIEAYVNAGGWFGAATGNVLQPGTWYHISFTFNGRDIKVYVDGAEAASNTSATALTPVIDPASPFHLGMSRNFQFSAADRRTMHGNINEVRFWNVALSAAEVEEHKAEQLTGAEAGLVAYWPFDVNLGLTVEDKTGKFTAKGKDVNWE